MFKLNYYDDMVQMDDTNLDEKYEDAENIESYKYHLFRCDDAPTHSDDPQDFIIRYKETGDQQYFIWYLHHCEKYITAIAKVFSKAHGLRDCLCDLKMIAAETMWERLDSYSLSAQTTFITYTRRYILNAMEHFAAEISGEFSAASHQQYVNLRRIAAVYNSTEGDSADDRIEATAQKLGISYNLAEKYICWALANKNMRSVNSNADGENTGNIYTDGSPLGDIFDTNNFKADNAVLARLDSEMLFSALDKLNERDRFMILGRTGVCPECLKAKKAISFDELADHYQLSSSSAARKAYLKALDNYIRCLVDEGFCHALTLKRTAVIKEKGQTVSVSYEYTADCHGQSGLIQFDFSNHSGNDDNFYEIVRYAEYDDFDEYAMLAVRLVRSMHIAEQKKKVRSGKDGNTTSYDIGREPFVKEKIFIIRADSDVRFRGV